MPRGRPRKDAPAAPPGERWCEAHKTTHPIAEFYQVSDPRYSGGVRFECKTLTKAKVAASHRDAGEGTPLREAIRRANRKYAQTHPEQNREKVAAHRKRKREPGDDSSSNE